jgi:hypothetical protein
LRHEVCTISSQEKANHGEPLSSLSHTIHDENNGRGISNILYNHTKDLGRKPTEYSFYGAAELTNLIASEQCGELDASSPFAATSAYQSHRKNGPGIQSLRLPRKARKPRGRSPAKVTSRLSLEWINEYIGRLEPEKAEKDEIPRVYPYFLS